MLARASVLARNDLPVCDSLTARMRISAGGGQAVLHRHRYLSLGPRIPTGIGIGGLPARCSILACRLHAARCSCVPCIPCCSALLLQMVQSLSKTADAIGKRRSVRSATSRNQRASEATDGESLSEKCAVC